MYFDTKVVYSTHYNYIAGRIRTFSSFLLHATAGFRIPTKGERKDRRGIDCI